MTLRTKIYIAAGTLALLIVMIGTVTLLSGHRIAEFERESQSARSAADQSETRARELEQRAAVYEKKIEYLEESLSALRSIAEKQDEELEILKATTGSARHTLDRVRAVRTLESTTADLCRKLAEAGHPCE